MFNWIPIPRSERLAPQRFTYFGIFGITPPPNAAVPTFLFQGSLSKRSKGFGLGIAARFLRRDHTIV